MGPSLFLHLPSHFIDSNCHTLLSETQDLRILSFAATKKAQKPVGNPRVGCEEARGGSNTKPGGPSVQKEEMLSRRGAE